MTRLSLDRLHDSIGDASHALQRRYAASLNDAQQAIARSRAAGRALARATADDVSRQMRGATRRTCDAIAARPLEAVAIAAVAGIAIGWLVRYLSEPRRRDPRQAGSRRAAPTSTAARRERAARPG